MVRGAAGSLDDHRAFCNLGKGQPVLAQVVCRFAFVRRAGDDGRGLQRLGMVGELEHFRRVLSLNAQAQRGSAASGGFGKDGHALHLLLFGQQIDRVTSLWPDHAGAVTVTDELRLFGQRFVVHLA